MIDELDAAKRCEIHLLDVGKDEYGDAVLCRFGNRVVLIDGAHPGDHDGTPGHPSIPQQIESILGANAPYPIDLLIISHAHQDHIGCLPKLIQDNKLEVSWVLAIDPRLGWGRTGNQDSFRDADPKVLQLTAALREEIHTERGTQDAAMERFLSDAANLETRYQQMLTSLEQAGKKVVRFGNPNTNLQELENEFSDIKLKILGPNNAHLLECAEKIREKTRDSLDFVGQLFKSDVGESVTNVYRRLVNSPVFSSEADSVDASSRPGPFINLQSVVTQFEFLGHKFLFAGDFQFNDPQTSNQEILSGVNELKSLIKSEAPYSFVKLSHHGSDNAFSEEMLTDLGETKFFGLCAGEDSTHHPAKKILKLLEKYREQIKWARTDHNGLVTLAYKKGKKEPVIKLEKGILNDAKPNFIDLTANISTPPPITPVSSSSITKTLETVSGSSNQEAIEKRQLFKVEPSDDKNFIEITAKIPNTATEISFSGNFTIKIGESSQKKSEVSHNETFNNEKSDHDPTFLIGRGRDSMRDLLFITSAEKLAENIGESETAQILNAFEKQQIPLLWNIQPNLTKSAEVAVGVQRKLSELPNIKGVVIIGGYDVIPAQILDTLPASLRNALPPNDDPDNFIVWNDEIYGDLDGDGLPEIPVSRIPDGKSAKLVKNALQAGQARKENKKFGIRNIARPFAIDIFNKISGTENLLVSKDTVFDQAPPFRVEADQIYFMLHGDYRDSSRFWGEDTPLNREAFHIYNMPENFQGVVFAGCCWGALTVDTPAGRIHPSRPFGLNTSESSIALSFLERGANAFVGCTGAHYSPTEAPFDYFGGPFHAAFWHFYNSGFSPAEALFRTKIEYINQMPHGRETILQQAIEYKILRQFTCLGLGW